MMSYNADSADTITANSLGVASSLGKILVHDIEPMTPQIDKVGTTDRRFASGAFSKMDISAGGLSYSMTDQGAAVSLTIPANSTSFVSGTRDFSDTKICQVHVMDSSASIEAWGWLPVSVNSYSYLMLSLVDTSSITDRVYTYKISIRRYDGVYGVSAIRANSHNVEVDFIFYK